MAGEGPEPPLLLIGAARWDDVMGPEHLDRLRRLRSLVAGGGRYDTTSTLLACFSGVGFSDELRACARQDRDVLLVGLADLYGGL
ncbi:hypothetical protein HNP84_000606 [Thermocatellispora tengchongensis]|uniref:Uncharacterized protein n=1 Tax=Thermocatellispora tengchongensis TaxID=1073253 RepID=A0A840NTL4_9ACTN|nr:hypothetical protein [Thermocatellispora tengchongensis]MBB5130918.1 hypothetical protein [Thermocatellispora tengchongensis]